MFYVSQIIVSQLFRILKENSSCLPSLYSKTHFRPWDVLCSNKFTDGCSSSCSSCKRREGLKQEKSLSLDGPEENWNSTHKGDEWLILVYHDKDANAKIPFKESPSNHSVHFCRAASLQKSPHQLALRGHSDTSQKALSHQLPTGTRR